MSADRTTEILNYLSAISREIGAFRTETNERLTSLETDMREVRAEIKDIRGEIKDVRREVHGLSERFDGRFDRLMKGFLDFRLRTTDLEQRVHALDGKHPDIDPY